MLTARDPGSVVRVAVDPSRNEVQTMTQIAPAAHTAERPAAISADWEWQLDGACRAGDGDLFFHPYGEREPSRSRRERAAQAVCAGCPVLLNCRSYALAAQEPYGVWGGMTETDRVEMLAERARRRDAPRHFDVA